MKIKFSLIHEAFRREKVWTIIQIKQKTKRIFEKLWRDSNRVRLTLKLHEQRNNAAARITDTSTRPSKTQKREEILRS